MPRPCKARILTSCPDITYFKPASIPKRLLEEIELNLDEFEAIKLSNIDELSMISGAEKMGVSSATFNRILKSANKKIAEALIEGKAIKINKK